MIYAGIDIGSTTAKAVLLDGTGICGSAMLECGPDPLASARDVLAEALRPLREKVKALKPDYVVGTGYGRREVPFADENISELTCHALGAHYLAPEAKTVIDVGGQDVKAIALKPDGTVREFGMNDKCAAGTGRFFEAMARAFRVDLTGFSKLSLASRKAIPITSQCSVFAESEVISLVSQRQPLPDIAAGVQESVARRVAGLARRVGLRPEVALTGGCAKNQGFSEELSRRLRMDILTLPFDPQLVGALGAAVLASRR